MDRPVVPSCEIELAFADGVYLFRLGLAQVAELQTKCDAGLGRIFGRVIKGRYTIETTGESFGNPVEADWRQEDIVETIRLGLIGGGRGVVDEQPVTVDPFKARWLVDNYVAGRPRVEGWNIAAAVLSATVVGYQSKEATDLQKKAQPAQTMDGSTSPAH